MHELLCLAGTDIPWAALKHLLKQMHKSTLRGAVPQSISSLPRHKLRQKQVAMAMLLLKVTHFTTVICTVCTWDASSQNPFQTCKLKTRHQVTCYCYRAVSYLGARPRRPNHSSCEGLHLSCIETRACRNTVCLFHCTKLSFALPRSEFCASTMLCLDSHKLNRILSTTIIGMVYRWVCGGLLLPRSTRRIQSIMPLFFHVLNQDAAQSKSWLCVSLLPCLMQGSTPLYGA